MLFRYYTNLIIKNVTWHGSVVEMSMLSFSFLDFGKANIVIIVYNRLFNKTIVFKEIVVANIATHKDQDDDAS